MDKAWKILVLSVCEEYSGKGIGTRLVEKSVDLASQKNYPLVVTNFSGQFTQRIGAKCGFEAVVELEYTKENYGNFDSMRPETVSIHKKCVAMVKKL